MRLPYRRTIAAVLVVGGIAVGGGIYALSDSSSVAEPDAIAGQGYSVSLEDDFDTLDTNVWTTSEEGAVEIDNGILEIHSLEANRPGGGGVHERSVTTGPEAGGQPSKWSQMFGYFEARMRWTPGQGSWPAFWLSSVAHAEHDGSCPEPDLNFELDIMEWLGAEPENVYATTHRNTNGYCGVPDASDGAAIDMNIDMSAGWHTYGVLWTSTEITWYVDDIEIRSDTTPYDSSDQEMYVLLTMQACGWDPPNRCDGTTPADLYTEVDWIRVWEAP